MFVAANINTFRGKFDVYGLFPDYNTTDVWINKEGLKIDSDYGLWSIIELKLVNGVSLD